MDESDKQCIGEMRQTRPTKLGPQQRAEHEYVHNGHNQVFPEIEPLTRRRHVAVTESRTRRDWGRRLRDMLETRYPRDERVVPVLDTLSPQPQPRCTRR